MANAEPEAAEQFPTGEHLREIADTAIHAADVIAKSVITDDLMSPVRSEIDENRLAVNEVMAKLELLFCIEPPGLQAEIEQHRAKWKYLPLVRGFPHGWRHEVAVPLQSLWRTVAGLLAYFLDREPLDLGAWTWQAGEFKRPVMKVECPPIPAVRFEPDGTMTRLDEGLPTVWLGRLRQHAQTLRDVLPELNEQKTTEATGRGSTTDDAEFVFRRDGKGYFVRGLSEQGRVSANGAKGLHDIYRLIQSPGVPVSMLELDAEIGTKKLGGDSQSKQPVADEQTKQSIATKRKQLQADIAEADSELERTELQNELESLEAEAAKLFGIGGKARDLNNPYDRLRSKLLARKTAACQRMKDEGLKELGSHFDLAIMSERGCLVYRSPIPNISWDTEPKV